MKYYGSILSFTGERNAALLKAYRTCVAQTPYIRLDEVGEKIVNSPSPRFWVSDERATAVVSAIMRGLPVLDTMRPTKREMFLEIYRRAMALRQLHPQRCLLEIISEVVNSPAPKFYMEPSSALERLFKIRNGFYDNGQKR
jgi:hypothetical protein